MWSPRDLPHSRASYDPPDTRNLLWGLGLGSLAGAVAYAMWSARRDRDGIAHRPPDDAPGRTAKDRSFGSYSVIGRTVTIGKSRQEIYDFWRDFSNLPKFMENVHAVETQGERTRWTLRAPAGRDVTIETEIVRDDPGREIAWASTDASDITTRGKVKFRDAPGERGTEVEAIIAYEPPGGELGRLVAKLFQAEPAIQGRRELKRLKMLLEAGEIATPKNHKAA